MAIYDNSNKEYDKRMKTYDANKVTDPNFFQGTWNVQQDEVAKYDPYISGYSFIYWTKLPGFFA